jgi:hypothetical protein
MALVSVVLELRDMNGNVQSLDGVNAVGIGLVALIAMFRELQYMDGPFPRS